jgi:hypothetical protein
MQFKCNLWKISLSSLYPSDEKKESVFWGYHFDEAKARDAALRWLANQNGGSTVDTILSVELIK